jgi:hypothetical protein
MVTLQELKDEITKSGGTVLDGASWEDSFCVYASSVETCAGCFGHPKYEASYNKHTGWLIFNFNGEHTERKLTEAN